MEHIIGMHGSVSTPTRNMKLMDFAMHVIKYITETKNSLEPQTASTLINQIFSKDCIGIMQRQNKISRKDLFAKNKDDLMLTNANIRINLIMVEGFVIVVGRKIIGTKSQRTSASSTLLTCSINSVQKR